MRNRSAAQLSSLVLLVWLGAPGGTSQAPKGWHEFVSTQGGYIAYYPQGWHILEPSPPTLYICNFPASRAVRAVIVPENGATIGIASPPAGVTTLAQWLDWDTAAPHRVRSRGSFVLQRTRPNPTLRVSEVVSESIDGPDSVSWYFDVSGRLLVARLNFWRGDPNEGKYRQVLREMLQVLAPLPR